MPPLATPLRSAQHAGNADTSLLYTLLPRKCVEEVEGNKSGTAAAAAVAVACAVKTLVRTRLVHRAAATVHVPPALHCSRDDDAYDP